VNLEMVANVLRLLALAAGLATIGELILGRRARDLFDWNRAFLIGASALAALLFPVCLLLGEHALSTVTVTVLLLLIGRGIYAISRRQTRDWLGSFARPLERWPEFDMATRLGIIAVLGSLIVFTWLTCLRGYAWDGLQIWATKAMVLHDRGMLTRDLLRGYGTNVDRVVNYPQLLPLLEAMNARLAGQFDWMPAKLACVPFYLSLILSIYRASRPAMSRALALAVVLVTALLPCIGGSTSFGGYADMPLAALAAASVAEAVRPGARQQGFRSPLAWCLAGLLTAKSEGILLLVIGCAVIAVYCWGENRRCWADAKVVQAGMVILLGLLLRVWYLSWTGIGDPDFWPNGGTKLADALPRLPLLPGLCAKLMFNWSNWAFFWPAFGVASLTIVWFARDVYRYVLGAVWLAILADSGMFLLTNWDMALHIESAYDRLLSHVAPIAAVCIGYACHATAQAAARQREAAPALAGDLPLLSPQLARALDEYCAQLRAKFTELRDPVIAAMAAQFIADRLRHDSELLSPRHISTETAATPGSKRHQRASR
jgi:hypothetical protein